MWDEFFKYEEFPLKHRMIVDEHSFGGRIGEASRIVTKDYALNYCMSRKSRKNHRS